ncbi:hypothetical protein BH10PSE9_BH10PSE9_13130 [soil metagenome]
MRKTMIAVGAALLLAAASSVAFSAEVDGSIASVDPTTNTITLTDGSTYTLPAGVSAAALQAGTRVRVIYQENGEGKLIASDVQPST